MKSGPDYETVSQLALALDRDDFVEAARHVHPECVYESPGGRMIGRDAIIDSYRKNAEWARAAFDRIEFESFVEPIEDGQFRVTYTDRTWHTPRGATSDASSQCSKESIESTTTPDAKAGGNSEQPPVAPLGKGGGDAEIGRAHV